jgi:molybdopterin converting factor small subunit
MRVTVRFFAQIKAAAGEPRRDLELPASASVSDAVRQAAAEGGPELKRLLLDDRGEVNETILLFVGEDPVSITDDRPLNGGDVLDIMTPISGG